MKLKSKLIGILGTAAIATTTLATVVSCKETEDTNGVYFHGSNVISPESGYKTYTIEGFELWTDLNKTSLAAVSVSSSNTSVTAEIEGGTYTPNRNFNVTVRASVIDPRLNESLKFSLYFTFYDANGIAKKKVAIGTFTFNYLGVWAYKEIRYIGTTEKVFSTKPGVPTYTSSEEFRLNNDEILATGESIYVEIRKDGAKDDDYICSAVPTNNIITFNIQNKNAIGITKLPDDTNLEIYFEIRYGNEVKWTSSTSEYKDEFTGFTYHYEPDWDSPTVSYKLDDNTDVVSEQGEREAIFNSAAGGNYIKLSKPLVSGEKIAISCSNNLLTAEATPIEAGSEYYQIKFNIEPRQEAFDYYSQHEYSTTLSVVLSKDGYEDRTTVIYNRTFTIKYTPLDAPPEYMFTMSKTFTTLKGEQLLTLPGSVYIPENFSVPNVVIKDTGTTSWESTSKDGSMISFDTSKQIENYSEYGFCSLFFNITNLPDGGYKEEEFKIKFTVTVSGFNAEGSEVSYDREVNTTIVYTPYDHANEMTDPYEYAKDRTVSLMCSRYDDSQAFQDLPYEYETATGWIVGKAGTSSDLKYYVATRWTDKKTFEDMRSTYGDDVDAEYHVGISDAYMGESTGTKQYNILNENYEFLDKNAITYISDSASATESGFLVSTGYWATNNAWGEQMNILTIDFGDYLKDTYRNYEHSRDMKNKLNKLEAYKKDSTRGKMTDLLLDPVQSTSQWSSLNYKCYLAGFGQTNVTYYDVNIAAPYWKEISIDTNSVAYYNAGQDAWSTSENIISGVLHRPCYYLYDKDGIPAEKWFDGKGFGSMLLVHNEKTNEFSVAGIYSGNARGDDEKRIFDVFSWPQFTYRVLFFTYTVKGRNMLEAYNN